MKSKRKLWRQRCFLTRRKKARYASHRQRFTKRLEANPDQVNYMNTNLAAWYRLETL